MCTQGWCCLHSCFSLLLINLIRKKSSGQSAKFVLESKLLIFSSAKLIAGSIWLERIRKVLTLTEFSFKSLYIMLIKNIVAYKKCLINILNKKIKTHLTIIQILILTFSYFFNKNKNIMKSWNNNNNNSNKAKVIKN
jgi:hypothetical protein